MNIAPINIKQSTGCKKPHQDPSFKNIFHSVEARSSLKSLIEPGHRRPDNLMGLDDLSHPDDFMPSPLDCFRTIFRFMTAAFSMVIKS